MYLYQKKYDQAEPLLLRSLNIREKALGPKHPEVANSLHNLGESLLRTASLRVKPTRFTARPLRSWRKASDRITRIWLTRLEPTLLLLQKTKRKSEASAMNARAQEILARTLPPERHTRP